MREATYLDRFTARRIAQQLRAGRPVVAAPARPVVAGPAARPAAVPIASAALTPAPAAQIAAAVATAVATERGRIRGILEAPEAKGREDSASAIAFTTDYTVTKARQVLGTLKTDNEFNTDVAVEQIWRAWGRKGRGTQQGASR